VVDEAFMSFGATKFMLDWSRNKSYDEKCIEGDEYKRFYETVLNILKTNW